MRMMLLVLALLAGVLPAQAQTRDTLRIGMVQFPPDMHPAVSESPAARAQIR